MESRDNREGGDGDLKQDSIMGTPKSDVEKADGAGDDSGGGDSTSSNGINRLLSFRNRGRVGLMIVLHKMPSDAWQRPHSLS